MRNGPHYSSLFGKPFGYEELEKKMKKHGEDYKNGNWEPSIRSISPQLYWVMAGTDFSLDINNPNEPKVLCIGNNPDRQIRIGIT